MINFLEEAVDKKGLSVRQLSIKSKVNKTTISRVMSDKTAGLSMEAGLKICKALKVDPRKVFIVY